MKASLRALLSGVIDYAGLFPPAKLPLEEAIRNYARYRTEPESWMLGRFVCPVARLAELAPFVEELFRTGPPLAISVIGRRATSMAEFHDGLKADPPALAAFRTSFGERVRADVYEMLIASREDIAEERSGQGLLVGWVSQALERVEPPASSVFIEVALGDDWPLRLRRWLASIRHHNHYKVPVGSRERLRFRPGGFKLRCGGLEATAFPSSKLIAEALTTARDEGVPLKLTAGLHHPIRHYDRSLQTHIHGFINVLGAGVLAYTRQLSAERVRQILEDEDAGNFHFDDECFRWKDLSAHVGEITVARTQAVTSFGSCSFDEPRDDLRALGLLV